MTTVTFVFPFVSNAMSTSAEDLSVYQVEQLVSYFSISPIAFVLYDWLMCLDLEVEHIWKSRLSITTLLYVVNRYISVPSAVFSFTDGVGYSRISCVTLDNIGSIFFVMSLFAASIFSAFRVWAIWGRNWIPFLVIFTVGLITPGINIYAATTIRLDGISPMQLPYGGCLWSSTDSAAVRQRIGIAARVGAIACDLLVLLATLRKTVRLKRIVDEAGVKASYTTMLIRDGTLYFVFLLAFNIACCVTENLPGPDRSPLVAYVGPVTSVLISRLLLNLRSINISAESGGYTNSMSTASDGTMRFASRSIIHIGTIGGSLDYGQELEVYDIAAEDAGNG